MSLYHQEVIGIDQFGLLHRNKHNNSRPLTPHFSHVQQPVSCSESTAEVQIFHLHQHIQWPHHTRSVYLTSMWFEQGHYQMKLIHCPIYYTIKSLFSNLVQRVFIQLGFIITLKVLHPKALHTSPHLSGYWRGVAVSNPSPCSSSLDSEDTLTGLGGLLAR